MIRTVLGDVDQLGVTNSHDHLFLATDVTEHGCGLIKVAGGYHGLDSHAVHTMTAAARAHHATDWMLPTLLTDLADAGFAAQLLLGGDTTSAGPGERPAWRTC